MSGDTPYHEIRWNVTTMSCLQRYRAARAVPVQLARAAPQTCPAARGDHAPPGIHGRWPRLRRQAAPGPYPTPA